MLDNEFFSPVFLTVEFFTRECANASVAQSLHSIMPKLRVKELAGSTRKRNNPGLML